MDDMDIEEVDGEGTAKRAAHLDGVLAEDYSPFVSPPHLATLEMPGLPNEAIMRPADLPLRPSCIRARSSVLALAVLLSACASSPPSPPEPWPSAATLAAGRGYVAHEGEWVRSREVELLQRGWRRFDDELLSPPQAMLAESGIFPCGGNWFDEDDADDYHSRVLRWWKMPAELFVAYSTCSRETTRRALEVMKSTRHDLLRLYGREPELPCTVILLRSVEQYNFFATTEPTADRIPPETIGFSAFQHAFLCEQWLDVERNLEHPGAACTYWDARSEAGAAWGPLAVRHAAALAFTEGLDPSLETTRTYRADPAAPFDSASFWAEKRLPRWLRFGGASYCERYAPDRAEEVQDPLWARRWSLEELKGLGGMLELEEIFQAALSQDEVAYSRQLLLSAGALVAFLLDGENAAVSERHSVFRDAVASRRDPARALEELEEVLRAEESALRSFTDS